MYISSHRLIILFISLLLLQLITPSVSKLNSNKKSLGLLMSPLQQSTGLKIIGPNGDTVPVVNENSQIMLTVMDANGQPVTNGLTFESDSPDVLTVNNNGMVTGGQQGYATVTVKMGGLSASAFVAVSKVNKGKGKKVPGDTKVDSSGAIYISDPINHTIFKKNNSSADANIFAGRSGVRGREDGEISRSTFSGPIGIAIDNRPKGGIYIADVLNNSIRKINFDNTVTTILGNGSQGTMGDVTPFSQAMFRNPQGVAIDSGGNLFIADTGNNAIYLADFSRQEVRLLAGSPGQSGKADGQGRTALFNRPVSISVKPGSSSFFASATNEVIFVADTGNGRIRSISRDGVVKTVGPIANTSANSVISPLADTEFTFNEPTAIEIDELGNIYVVEKSGVRVISQNVNGSRQVMSLAQNDSFQQATSVVVQGTQAVVLDRNAINDDEAVKTVTIGAPIISSMSKTLDRLEGGSEVIITGKNFAPESLVILGDTVITDAIIESATRIRIAQVPKQKAPGDRTLSVRTRGGVAQTKFSIFSKPFSEIKTGEITTIAGGVPFLGDSGLATNATFNGPQDVLVDSNGNILISDSGSGRIRRIDDTNVITTIAGTGAITSNGDNSLAIAAGLNVPTSTAIDSAGNIFIADSRGDRVRKIDARTGIITSAVGTGINGFSGDNGQANNARLSFPIGVAIDSFDNLYIADSGNSRIRKVNLKTNIITTVAGSSRSGFSGDGGPATLASLGFVNQVNVDSLGNIFIVDNSLDPEANARIRRVDIRTGVITTVAGNGSFRFNGDNIPALSASIDPFDVEIDQAGNIFFADLANHRIRRVDARTAIITTVAGNGISAFSGDGTLATNASLSAPNGIALDGMGNLIIADQLNNRVRKVDARTGIITTIAGSELPIGDNDLAIKANVGDPFSVVVESSGNILISDTGNRRVRRVNINNGSITTIAGNGTLGFSGDNGPATEASFAPNTIAQDSNGNIFIVDPVFHVVRRITPTGTINTVAGTGRFGFSGDNGPATNAQLDSPRGIAVDSAGNLFIADLFNNRIRRVDARTGIITSVAGNGRANITGDGGPATQASLAFPLAVTVDKNNNIFILDLVGNLVRRVDARTGIITTIAGTGDASFSGDGGPAINAAINTAFGLTADNNGNLFIADTGNSRIRRIDASGIITTVAGNNTPDYSGDGLSATTASLNRPKGIAFDSAGNLYIAGGFNNAIRVVKAMTTNNALTITNAQFIKPNLTITGNGFTSSGAVVQVNGQNISQFITSQSATSITLKGNKKKLNIKKGQNSVTVTVNGMVSNTFNFNF